MLYHPAEQMSTPSEPTAPTESTATDGTAANPTSAAPAPSGGWRRWMPRKRATPPSGGPEPDGGEPPVTATDEPSAAEVAPPAGHDRWKPTPSQDPPSEGGGDNPSQAQSEPETPSLPEPPTETTSTSRWGRGRRTDRPSVAAEQPDRPAVADDAEDSGRSTEADAESPAVSGGRGALTRRRRKLERRRQIDLFHLGGLALELHVRRGLVEPVLAQRADGVLRVDADIARIDERLAQLTEAKRTATSVPVAPGDLSAGCCVACRADFRVGARFCWQCGTGLPTPAPTGDQDQQVTQTIAVEGAE